MDRRGFLRWAARSGIALSAASGLVSVLGGRASASHGQLPPGLKAGLVRAGERFKEYNVLLQLHKFTPEVIEVEKGDRVRLNLQALDVDHGFYLDGYNIDVTVPGLLAIKSVEFVADRAGAYRFRCSTTCGPFHPFMIGKLVVRPNYRFWAALGSVALAPVATLAYLIARRNGNGERIAEDGDGDRD